MAQAETVESFRQKANSVFVVGYTGETGKEVVRQILNSRLFGRVVLIGRRQIQFSDEIYKDVEQKVVDYEKLDEHSDVFQGIDIGFCCLGTTRSKAGKEGFYKVDHDYILNVARLAKAGGCKHFHLESSTGADSHSMFYYTKIKGQVDEEIQQLGFERLSIYRPGVLMCDREESRPGESCIQCCLKPFTFCCPTTLTTPTSILAVAMTTSCLLQTTVTEIYENKDIHRMYHVNP